MRTWINRYFPFVCIAAALPVALFARTVGQWLLGLLLTAALVTILALRVSKSN